MMSNTTFTHEDVYYMSLAIAEAKKGEFTTRPNPAVGCVIVKDGKIIGTGFHLKAGQPHAEVFALRAASTHGTQGATAYVTLEPCSHTGRTPPCADALIGSGVSRVVVAGLDPNPKVAGNGIKKLQDAGIDVAVGVCADEARQLNLGFLKAMQTGRPYVRLKVAASLDGRTAMATGESKWITGAPAREDVQRLRAKSAAIITGSGTIMADNPALNVRSAQLGVPSEMMPQPKIVVIDRRGRIDANDEYQALKHPDTLLWQGGLEQLLDELVQVHQCYDVLVEAGATLSGVFIQADLVDELIVYQAPCILGTSTKPMFDITIDQLSLQHRYRLNEVCQIGNDIRQVYTRII